MNKKILASVVLSAALLGTGTMISQSNTAVVEAKSYQKGYTTKKSIVYKNSRGFMRIYEVKGFHIKNVDNSSLGSQITVYGSFKNKSKKAIKPDDFFMDHFGGYQVSKNKWHQLDFSYPMFAPSNYASQLRDNGDDYVRPGKTVRFVIADEEPQHIYAGQKIVIRAYKDAYGPSGRLASKNFYLPSVKSTKDHDGSDDEGDA